MELGSIRSVGSFDYSDDRGFSYAVRYNYSVDLDGDGVDELIFAGFETQPNTPAGFDNTKLTIYGWSGGQFRDITEQWLPGSLSQVEGVGEIVAGDFNGDGRTDLYLSAYADMDHQVNAYQLLNTGSSFNKVSLGLSQWEHGAAVGDLNQDGYDDVVVFGYLYPVPLLLGGPDGLTKGFASTNWPHTDGYLTNGSGGVIGDFYGDGTMSVVTSDNGTIADADTLLSRLYINEQGVAQGFGSQVALPAPILGTESHDVRARALDFNHDGLLDVLVFSRQAWDGKQWPENSRIQFLQNNGNGNFVDVTDTKLVDYQTASNVTYTPVFRDFNQDGLIDIFVSESDFDGSNRSTALLMQQSNGTFVDTGRSTFARHLADGGGMAGIVLGPSGQYHVVFENQTEGGRASLQMAALSFPEREQSEYLQGTALGEKIFGLGGNDTIAGLAGDDTIDGGDGVDTAVIASAVADVSSMGFTADGSGLVISSADGTDTLNNIETIAFTGQSFAPYELRSVLEPSLTFAAVIDDKTVSLNPTFFTGQQDLGLHYQLIDTTPDAIVVGSIHNDFIALQGGGVKAVDGGQGNDVIDGGVGSTFVTGGGGSNTIFLDGRADGTSWSTITDFQLGQDKVTVWGWREGVSRIQAIEVDGGDENYSGVTLHFENLLPDDASDSVSNPSLNSVTFTGLALEQFGVSSVDELNEQILAQTNDYFAVGQTVDQFGTHGYLHIE
jgi:hypothetical protein